LYPGNPIAVRECEPNPILWWLRAAIIEARDGEHNAVVWKLLYRKPLAANLSIFGVSVKPPKLPKCPKPVSSSSINNTFGVPFAGLGELGHHSSESS